jgi:hypothetical protein
MDEYILIFRMDITTKEAQPSPDQMERYMQQWEAWVSSIAARGQLAEGGNHLSAEGRVLRPNAEAVNGPYTENRQSVAGYILIQADSLEDATAIAGECPILGGEGTSVEVRRIE